MSVSPKLCIKYEADASKITLKDETGQYVANHNDSGYGNPNQNRNEFAGVLVAKYIGYDESNTEIITNLTEYVDYDATYGNDHISTFEIPYKQDGWHQYHYILVPNVIASPEEGDIYYDETAGKLLQYDNGLLTVDVYDIEKLFNASKYKLTKVDEMPTAKLSAYANGLAIDHFIGDYCSNNEKELLLINNVRLIAGIRTVKTLFNVSKLEAQRIVEKLLDENNL